MLQSVFHSFLSYMFLCSFFFGFANQQKAILATLPPGVLSQKLISEVTLPGSAFSSVTIQALKALDAAYPHVVEAGDDIRGKRNIAKLTVWRRRGGSDASEELYCNLANCDPKHIPDDKLLLGLIFALQQLAKEVCTTAWFRRR